MKKEVQKFRGRIDKRLLQGVLYGFLGALVVFFLFYGLVGIRTSEDRILVGTDEVIFNLKEVHKTVDRDFPGGTVPVYNNEFCMKKYEERYSKDIDQCEIRSIRTFSRLNPLVIDIDCVCFD